MVQVVCPRCKATLPADAWRSGPVTQCPACHGHVALPAHLAATIAAEESDGRSRTFTGWLLHTYLGLTTAVLLVVFCCVVGALLATAWFQTDNLTSDLVRVKTAQQGGMKLPLPNSAELELAEQQLQATFQKDIAAATTPALKRDMAGQLLRFARETGDNPAARYATYRAAQRLATEAFAPEVALEAAAAVAQHFQVDAEKEEQAALEGLARNANDAATLDRLFAFLRDMIGQSLKAANYTKAVELADFALATSRQQHAGKVWQTEMAAERDEIVAAQEALNVLESKPDDPHANYRLGRFLCVVLGDWAAALPRLAKGAEPTCQAAAILDQAGAANATEQKKLGDAWWATAEGMAGDTPWQMKLRGRARGYYEKALPNLSPSQRQIIEPRLR